VVVELDGRLFHDAATGRDRDLERDLDTATDGRSTVRLGWGQVFERPCSTAAKVGRLLQLAGWSGRFARAGWNALHRGTSPPPGDGDVPR